MLTTMERKKRMTEQDPTNGGNGLDEDEEKEQVQLTESDALAYLANPNVAMDVRFEVAVSFIHNLIAIRNRLGESLHAIGSRLGAQEAMSYVMLRRWMHANMNLGEVQSELDGIRDEITTFSQFTSQNVISVWDYVMGRSLEEAVMSEEELAEATKAALRDQVDEKIRDAAQKGDLREGVCEAYSECRQPYDCTSAQRCLGKDVVSSTDEPIEDGVEAKKDT